jgi:hypothetical protein
MEKKQEPVDFVILINSLKQINKRCEELNDVKLSLRQLNQTVKNDILTNLDPLVNVIKQKLLEFSEEIKEKVKLRHKFLGERQKNLSGKTKNLLQFAEIAQKMFIEDKDQNSKELYFWAIREQEEIQKELSKFEITDFYPSLNYSVPTGQIKDAINSIKMDFCDDDEQGEEKLKKVGINQASDCVITSGLADDGKFWLQLSENNQSTRVIDDISDFVSYKHITDSTWLTFYEDPQKRVPELQEKCFCFNNKSKKWLRVVVEEFNNKTLFCKVRFCDTNQFDNEVRLDKLMKWKDFNLNNIDFQSVRCCLFVPRSEKRFMYHTKYLFKDMTHNKKLKCVFKQFLDNNTWLVELYSQLDYEKRQHCSFNKYIIDDYNEQLCMKKTRTCDDIRLGDNNPAFKIFYDGFSDLENNLRNKVTSDSKVESVKDMCLTESCNIRENIAKLIMNVDIGDILVVADVISDIISKIESSTENKLYAKMPKKLTTCGNMESERWQHDLYDEQ